MCVFLLFVDKYRLLFRTFITDFSMHIESLQTNFYLVYRAGNLWLRILSNKRDIQSKP